MGKTYRRNSVAAAMFLRGNRGGGAHQDKSKKRRHTRSSQRQDLQNELEEYFQEREENEE